MSNPLEDMAKTICHAIEEIGLSPAEKPCWQDYLYVARQVLDEANRHAIQATEKQELVEYRQLATAISMGLPVWPTSWSQDVAATAFAVSKMDRNLPNIEDSDYEKYISMVKTAGLMPWYQD